MSPHALLAISCVLAASAAGIATSPPAEPSNLAKLPPGDGRNTLLRVCGSCHAVEIVANHHLDAVGWNAMVETMAKNGAVATDAELAEVAAYLIHSFPPSETDKPGAKPTG